MRRASHDRLDDSWFEIVARPNTSKRRRSGMRLRLDDVDTRPDPPSSPPPHDHAPGEDLLADSWFL